MEEKHVNWQLSLGCCFTTNFVCNLDTLSCLESQLSIRKGGSNHFALSEVLKRQIQCLDNARRTLNEPFCPEIQGSNIFCAIT